METERGWRAFVDGVAVVWLCLFVVDVAAGADLIVLSEDVETVVRRVLRALFVVFVLDLLLLYRWSDDDLGPFLRSNWFLALTVVPWFRPLRALRAGRGLRALRLLAGSRRAGSLYNKIRRMGTRAWRRLRR